MLLSLSYSLMPLDFLFIHGSQQFDGDVRRHFHCIDTELLGYVNVRPLLKLGKFVIFSLEYFFCLILFLELQLCSAFLYR